MSDNPPAQGPVTSRTYLLLPEDKTYACVLDFPGYMSFFDPDCETKSSEWVFSLSPILPPGESLLYKAPTIDGPRIKWTLRSQTDPPPLNRP